MNLSSSLIYTHVVRSSDFVRTLCSCFCSLRLTSASPVCWCSRQVAVSSVRRHQVPWNVSRPFFYDNVRDLIRPSYLHQFNAMSRMLATWKWKGNGWKMKEGQNGHRVKDTVEKGKGRPRILAKFTFLCKQIIITQSWRATTTVELSSAEWFVSIKWWCCLRSRRTKWSSVIDVLVKIVMQEWRWRRRTADLVPQTSTLRSELSTCHFAVCHQRLV